MSPRCEMRPARRRIRHRDAAWRLFHLFRSRAIDDDMFDLAAACHGYIMAAGVWLADTRYLFHAIASSRGAL